MKNRSTTMKILSDLPEDVVMNVLSRLPVETILAVRQVNKFFYQLTCTDDFIKAYDNFMIKNGSWDAGYRVFRFQLDGPLIEFRICHSSSPVHLGPVQRYDGMVGACNDLLCTQKAAGQGHPGGLSLRHPCRVSKPLLLPPLVASDDPMCLHITFGFGYDETKDVYKVVAFCLYRQLKVKSYYSVVLVCSTSKTSSENCSWRLVDDNYREGVLYPHSSVFAGGNVHWFTDPSYSLSMIVSFNVEMETIGVVEEPDYDHSSIFNRQWFLNNDIPQPECTKSLSILDGCLCVFYDNNSIEFSSSLWVMKSYGITDSWAKLFTIRKPRDFVSLRFCCMLPNHDDVLFATGSNFVCYSLERQVMFIPDKQFYDQDNLPIGVCIRPSTQEMIRFDRFVRFAKD